MAELSYRPGHCGRDYRVVALRKDLSVEKGDNVLFNEYRYFFYITNDWEMTPHQVVAQARSRCNQENLIAQLKGQVRALHAPVNTLVANWAYMVMAALAWSIKAWCALSLPVRPRWAKEHNEQRRRLLTMDFRSFLATFIEIPCQIIKEHARCGGGPCLEPLARDLLQAPRRPLSASPSRVCLHRWDPRLALARPRPGLLRRNNKNNAHRWPTPTP